MLTFGIDNLISQSGCLCGRTALITTPSGRTLDNRSTVDALAGLCDLQLLLSPEHGIRGDKAAGAMFADEIDTDTGIPVVSLYTPTSKRLLPQTLERFDTLVYDIQDVGCRYYTFITTLRYLLEDCAGAGKRLVVLDRPNPLGDRLEGSLLRPEYGSFVGGYTLPVCYGLTCGELAQLINQEEQLGCDLHVVPCGGLTRDMTFRDWGRYWVMPSLGLPRWDSARLYPGTCLIEGTNLSEGRGTADPFAIIGAPYIRAEQLSAAFNAMHIPGLVSTPIYFTPTTSKHQGSLCGGIHLHITGAFPAVEMGIRLLDLLRQMYPRDFAFLPPVRQNGRPFISLLTGSDIFEAPDWDADSILRTAEADCAAFRQRREPCLIYGKESL